MNIKPSAILLVTFLVPCSAWAQFGPPPAARPNGPAPVLQQAPRVSFSGSVPVGQATVTPLDLPLREAIRRGLSYNLGILANRDIVDTVKAERRRTLSTLLPNVSAGFAQNVTQLNLVAFGFAVPGFPSVAGPFHTEDLRAYGEQTVYDRVSLKNLKSATESQRAVELTAEDARNLVVQAVSNAYLGIITDASRVDAIQAEIDTAKALYDRAVDQKKAGTVAGIDVLRAQLQLQTEQQRLLAQQNQVEKGKLTLSRVIGLPAGQKFNVVDTLPFTPLETGLDDLLKQAYAQRSDYRAAEATIRAAQYAVEAARSEHYPSVVVAANYGDIGTTLAHSHGTFSVEAGIRVPIYSGGRTQTDIDQAETVLRNRKNALEDLRGRIDYEVRNALLDLKSALDQVVVAKANADLAAETLAQARDRFGAGVTDNIEVIQAQQLLAAANENYIASLSAHNAGKIALASALGSAEESVPRYLNLKP